MSISFINASVGLWVDIGIVAIILIATLLGLLRGFMRSLFSLIKFAGSFVIAFLLRNPIGSLINRWFNLTSKVSPKIQSYLSGFSNGLITTSSNDPNILKYEIENSGLSSLLKKIGNSLIGDQTLSQNMTVSDVFSIKAASIISALIAFIVVYVLIRVLSIILPKLFKKLTKKSILGKFDRIFGILFGFVKGVAFVFSMFFVMSLVSLIPPLTDKINNVTSESKICSVLYEPVNNFIYEKTGLTNLSEKEN